MDLKEIFEIKKTGYEVYILKKEEIKTAKKGKTLYVFLDGTAFGQQDGSLISQWHNQLTGVHAKDRLYIPGPGSVTDQKYTSPAEHSPFAVAKDMDKDTLKKKLRHTTRKTLRSSIDRLQNEIAFVKKQWKVSKKINTAKLSQLNDSIGQYTKSLRNLRSLSIRQRVLIKQILMKEKSKLRLLKKIMLHKEDGESKTDAMPQILRVSLDHLKRTRKAAIEKHDALIEGTEDSSLLDLHAVQNETIIGKKFTLWNTLVSPAETFQKTQKGIIEGVGVDSNIIHVCTRVANKAEDYTKIVLVGWSRGAVTIDYIRKHLNDMGIKASVFCFKIDPVSGGEIANLKTDARRVVPKNVSVDYTLLAFGSETEQFSPESLEVYRQDADTSPIPTDQYYASQQLKYFPMHGTHGQLAGVPKPNEPAHCPSVTSKELTTALFEDKFLSEVHQDDLSKKPKLQQRERESATVIAKYSRTQVMKRDYTYHSSMIGKVIYTKKNRVFTKQLPKYVKHSQFFVNRDHEERFQEIYPKIYKQLTGSAMGDTNTIDMILNQIPKNDPTSKAFLSTQVILRSNIKNKKPLLNKIRKHLIKDAEPRHNSYLQKIGSFFFKVSIFLQNLFSPKSIRRKLNKKLARHNRRHMYSSEISEALNLVSQTELIISQPQKMEMTPGKGLPPAEEATVLPRSRSAPNLRRQESVSPGMLTRSKSALFQIPPERLSESNTTATSAMQFGFNL